LKQLEKKYVENLIIIILKILCDFLIKHLKRFITVKKSNLKLVLNSKKWNNNFKIPKKVKREIKM